MKRSRSPLGNGGAHGSAEGGAHNGADRGPVERAHDGAERRHQRGPVGRAVDGRYVQRKDVRRLISPPASTGILGFVAMGGILCRTVQPRFKIRCT